MGSANKIRVGIIERCHMLRDHLADIIRSQNDMVLAFSTSELDQKSNLADVILMQWEISKSSLIYQHSDGLRPKILVFNADVQAKGFVHGLHQGARGFVLSNSPTEEILRSIRMVMETGWAIPASAGAKISMEIIESTIKDFGGLLQHTLLTSRERQIVGLMLEELTNGEIANRLNIATSTVKNHVHGILKKSKHIGLCNRTDITSYLRRVNTVRYVHSDDEKSKDLIRPRSDLDPK